MNISLSRSGAISRLIDKINMHLKTFVLSVLPCLAVAATAATATEPEWNIRAVESRGQQMVLELAFDEKQPTQTVGRFTTGKSGCTGTLTIVGRTKQNEFLFEETLESGRCVANCKLALSASFDRYREFCTNGAKSSGNLDTLEKGADIRDRLAARQNEPKTSYAAKDFSGVDVWVQAFEKMTNDPKGFKEALDRMATAAGGVNAKAYGLIGGGARNHFQKFFTDLQLYSLYERKPAALLEKARQCTVAREYTHEEACDCTAGFPGDTRTGAGAGELVVGSNVKLILAACGKAAEDAKEPSTKARYLAQRARGQVRTMDQSKAVPWIEESLSLGFKRASIVFAQAQLTEIEVRSGGFPPPSENDYKQMSNALTKRLETSKKDGVLEVYIVAEQLRQVFDRLKWNSSVLTPLYREMTKPPPDLRCEPLYGKIGVEADGRPMIGMKDVCYRR